MKCILLFLISVASYGQNYQLDVAGKTKLKDTVRISYTHGVVYSDSSKIKTSNKFYYVDSTETLFVPNIAIGIESFKRLKKINADFIVDDKTEIIFVDASQRDIFIKLDAQRKEGKVVYIEKKTGRHKVYVNGESIRRVKLIYDGIKWQRIQ